MKTRSFSTWPSAAVFSLLFSVLFSNPVLAIGTPFLIKDMTIKAAPANVGSLFDAGGGVIYFSATNGTSGNELFKYDGTSVTLVKDINPGPSSSYPGNFVQMGGFVYFTADDGTKGRELWKTDGTPGGTQLVSDINTNGASSSNPGMLAVMGGWLYFVADDGINGSELWKTDGTVVFLVKDINPGITGSSIQYLKAIGTKLFFWANDGTTGLDLWTSDGTTAGTKIVADLNLYPYSPIYDLNGKALFAANDGYTAYGVEVWSSDGTAGGTAMVKDITSGTADGFHGSEFGLLGSYAYFMGGDMSAGSQNLYRTDGTFANTGYFDSVRLPKKFVTIGTVLYFVGYQDATGLYSIWKYDSTSTTKVATPSTVIYWNNSNQPDNLTNINGTLYFTSPDSTLEPTYPTTYYLWRIDINGNPVRVTTKISAPQNLTNVGGTLYITAGGELWKSDGTDAGTVMVTINTAGTTGTTVTSAININGTTYFVADDGVNGTELWKSDGTTSGTVLVKDIYPGFNGSQPQSLTNVNGTLVFTAYDPTNGYALWKSDGTDANTIPLSSFQSSPQSLTNVNGQLYFAGDTSSAGWALWKSDGTVAGTVIVKDLDPSPYGAAPTNLTNVGGTLFFAGDDGTNGLELWKSDGTAGGTVMVKDINQSLYPGTSPAYLTNVGGTLFFTAYDSTNGTELWKSDGTDAGTVLVKDINQGEVGSNPIWLTAIGGKLYFAADDGTYGYQLFVSDGTVGGTSSLKTINLTVSKNAFDPYTNPMFTEMNGVAFFVADDGSTGMELWKSDGTPAGTMQVKDINPGATSSSITNLLSSNGTLYFVANDGASGAELWQSDGTAAGTVMAADVLAGSSGSNPTFMVTNGLYLHFFADDGTHGNELMGMNVAFAVNFASGGNGALTGSTTQTVNPGGSTTNITATASSGYHFVNWTGTGGFVSTTANPLTVTNVTTTMTITANFAADSTPSVDAVAPVVTGFTIPAVSQTLTVPITTFTASDAVGVSAYLLSESATPPLVSDPAWAAAAQTSHTFTTWGNRILYAYAKDAAGNISLPLSAMILIGVDGVIVPAPAKIEPQLSDAMKSLNFAMKVEIPTATDLSHGDVAPLVNGVPQPDGVITLGDTIVILRRVVGL